MGEHLTKTEDIEGMIKAIINANKNLTESNNRNDMEDNKTKSLFQNVIK